MSKDSYPKHGKAKDSVLSFTWNQSLWVHLISLERKFLVKSEPCQRPPCTTLSVERLTRVSLVVNPADSSDNPGSCKG